MRRLKTAMALCSAFLVVEVVGGYFAGSLAILSDAAHLFADVASFAVAIGAAHLASLPPTDYHTFGLKRTESLAALLSMISLALVSVYLAMEAVRRLYKILAPNQEQEEVNGKLMSQVAAIGVIVNLALGWVLGVENHVHLPGADHDHSHDHGHHGEDDHGHHHGHGHDNHEEEEQGGHKSHSGNSTKDGHDHQGEHEHEHEHSHSHHASGLEDHSHEHHHDGDVESAPLLHSSDDCHADHGPKSYNSVASQKEHTKKKNKSESSPLRNVNLHAAYLHVLGDLLQSVGVLIAGLIIWYNPQWAWVDPVCTLFFCACVFYSTLSVLRNSVAVLLQETPSNVNWQHVYDSIESIEGVKNVHDLHIWSISHGIPSLSVHCSSDGDPQVAMKRISSLLKNEMGIHHITIQVQEGTGDCITCANVGCDSARLEERNSFRKPGSTSIHSSGSSHHTLV